MSIEKDVSNEISRPLPEKRTTPAKRAATVIALGGLAVIGHKIQSSGLTYEIPDYPRVVIDSFKHPIVGYLGAAAGHMTARIAADKSGRKAGTASQVTGMLIGATAANFGAEQAQSMFYAIDEYKNYFSQQQTPETIKDYTASLLGLLLYRRQLKPRSTMSRWNELTFAAKVILQRKSFPPRTKNLSSDSRQNRLQQYA